MSGREETLTTAVAHQWLCDHFGHLNVRSYAAMFDDAIFVFWARQGWRPADAAIPVTASFQMSFKSEVTAGTIVETRAEVVRLGTKSVTVAIAMAEHGSGRPLAACEIVEVFMGRASRESAPIPPALRERLSAKEGPTHPA